MLMSVREPADRGGDDAQKPVAGGRCLRVDSGVQRAETVALEVEVEADHQFRLGLGHHDLGQQVLRAGGRAQRRWPELRACGLGAAQRKALDGGPHRDHVVELNQTGRRVRPAPAHRQPSPVRVGLHNVHAIPGWCRVVPALPQNLDGCGVAGAAVTKDPLHLLERERRVLGRDPQSERGPGPGRVVLLAAGLRHHLEVAPTRPPQGGRVVSRFCEAGLSAHGSCS